MKRIINLDSFPVRDILSILLKDKTTNKNIIFATAEYKVKHPGIEDTTPIIEELLLGEKVIDLQPRVLKSQAEQAVRTKKKAEVFTPSWICNKMNNHCDKEWFGRENVFNIEMENDWIIVSERIEFPEDKTWKDYIDSTRLEITCGEAPYIVSRYDAATGELIPIEKRIGILDRKLRVINENTHSKVEWFRCVYRAFKSVYGYEYQGDNLLIARINLLMTFYEYVKDRWNCEPTMRQLQQISDIISWNFWQMDGLKGIVPNGGAGVMLEEKHQISLFEIWDAESKEEECGQFVECQIFDWKNKQQIKYNDLKRGVK